MPLPPDEQALRCRFARDSEVARLPAMREIERRVLGCDYGGTSWTTRDEAARIVDLLRLRPAVRLLDVGAGSGWPGLYLAKLANCEVVLVDVPITGLQIAIERATADDMRRQCEVAVADGAALPFSDRNFDALNHSDVLCCLAEKSRVLRECRRVARDGARMVFSVISPAPYLSAEQHRVAVQAGPPHVDAPADYGVLLREANWVLLERIDATEDFMRALRDRNEAVEAAKDALIEMLGSDEYDMRRKHRQDTMSAVADGLLRREIFVAQAGTARSIP
jgi:SAM-dependent methyltransferase